MSIVEKAKAEHRKDINIVISLVSTIGIILFGAFYKFIDDKADGHAYQLLDLLKEDAILFVQLSDYKGLRLHAEELFAQHMDLVAVDLVRNQQSLSGSSYQLSHTEHLPTNVYVERYEIDLAISSDDQDDLLIEHEETQASSRNDVLLVILVDERKSFYSKLFASGVLFIFLLLTVLTGQIWKARKYRRVDESIAPLVRQVQNQVEIFRDSSLTRTEELMLNQIYISFLLKMQRKSRSFIIAGLEMLRINIEAYTRRSELKGVFSGESELLLIRQLESVAQDLIASADEAETVTSTHQKSARTCHRFSDLIDYTAEKYIRHANDKGISLNLLMTGDSDATIHVDHDHVVLLLASFIENSIISTSKGHISINIQCNCSDRDKMLIVAMSMTDTGHGLPEDQVNWFNQIASNDHDGMDEDKRSFKHKVLMGIVRSLKPHIEVANLQFGGTRYFIELKLPMDKTEPKLPKLYRGMVITRSKIFADNIHNHCSNWDLAFLQQYDCNIDLKGMKALIFDGIPENVETLNELPLVICCVTSEPRPLLNRNTIFLPHTDFYRLSEVLLTRINTMQHPSNVVSFPHRSEGD